MIFVGIDVASDKHDVMIMNNSHKQFQKNPLRIANNSLGFKKLHETIQNVCGANQDYTVRIGLESTGFFHINLVNFLLEKNYGIMVINPLLTKSDKKRYSVRPQKTDKIDAIALCKYVSDTNLVFIPYTRQSYHNELLKSLSRNRFSLVERRTREKLTVFRIVTLIFPEYIKLFSNLCSVSSLNILAKYLSADKIAKAHTDTLKSLIHGKCQITAEQIKEAAKNTIGSSNEAYELELKHAIENINALNNQIADYDNLIKKTIKESNIKLLSIPGISYITAATILGEIGDISRFKSPDSILSYAGLDLIVYESGKYKSSGLHISKKGSRYLRHTLFQVAKIIWQCDKQFNEYYTKKKNEGKPFLTIMGHIQKKLVRVRYSVLKNDKDYVVPQN